MCTYYYLENYSKAQVTCSILITIDPNNEEYKIQRAFQVYSVALARQQLARGVRTLLPRHESTQTVRSVQQVHL